MAPESMCCNALYVMAHKAGDLLLYEVAQRTRYGIRAGDILARMGGDEFTLWLHGLQSSEQAHMTAERMPKRPVEIPFAFLVNPEQ